MGNRGLCKKTYTFDKSPSLITDTDFLIFYDVTNIDIHFTSDLKQLFRYVSSPIWVVPTIDDETSIVVSIGQEINEREKDWVDLRLYLNKEHNYRTHTDIDKIEFFIEELSIDDNIKDKLIDKASNLRGLQELKEKYTSYISR